MTDEVLTDRDIRIKQLKLRAWRRGFREHDFIMGNYADQHLANLSDNELDQFDALLNEQDWDVYYWIVGQKQAPEEFNGSVLKELQTLATLKNTLWEGDVNS